ncbi:MAG: aminoacyl-tRNA hydrolase [Eggerthellaceae bacterium]|nr:aminoacyl-tRNA hydrolase [Eggerthellaceae bacterium]
MLKTIDTPVVIVGLGNPGPEYEHTRHNAGFDAVDAIAQELGASYWKNEHGALTARCSYDFRNAEHETSVVEVLLVKPQGYMNTSGGPLKNILKAYKVHIKDVIVIHDELDILPGTIRVKNGGGLAGHNGLKSIAEKCQSKDFLRIRVGIGRPPGKMSVTDWVLQVPKKEAWDDFLSATQEACKAALFLLSHSVEQTQQQFN